ncbi:hypothetical protein HA156_23440 [Escherichia coli]|nr:PAAR domain-containing protein [Escherichia coli]EHL6304206.1 PAAR domain-containing protein [Escherichia coli]NHR32874.1 hypothetical protein [Escherichia coli]HDW4070641.1 PAAR domain-containing protein [Escherichia coli]HEB5751183.1 PAAR domain-containing protein [Escherichia coli]
MVKGVVLFGDKTTHGGQVISASSNITVNGKNVALVGGMIQSTVADKTKTETNQNGGQSSPDIVR